jgi:hypothetical protein
MEEKIRTDPFGFIELEKSSAKFGQFAYETHVVAYCESGWGQLPQSDNDLIRKSVDTLDLLRGFGSAISISSKCGSLEIFEQKLEKIPDSEVPQVYPQFPR